MPEGNGAHCAQMPTSLGMSGSLVSGSDRSDVEALVAPFYGVAHNDGGWSFYGDPAAEIAGKIAGNISTVCVVNILKTIGYPENAADDR